MLQNMTTVRGATVDEAIEKGLRELGITRDQAEIHVLREGKKGFLGFGQKDAIVEVRGFQDISYKELTEQLEQADAPKEEKPASTVSEQPKVEPSAAKETKKEVVTEKPAGKPTPEPVKPASPVQADKPAVASSAAPKPSADESKEKVEKRTEDLDEAAEKVSRYIESIIHQYGAEAKVHYEIDGRQLFFDIDTDKSGLVIGRHGQIINALQILAQTYLLSLYYNHLNVVLNVGDYRKRRQQVLEQMAINTANEVLSTHEPVVLDNLPAYERKQIHRHLSGMANISTRSHGREPHRALVVEYREHE